MAVRVVFASGVELTVKTDYHIVLNRLQGEEWPAFDTEEAGTVAMQSSSVAYIVHVSDEPL